MTPTMSVVPFMERSGCGYHPSGMTLVRFYMLKGNLDDEAVAGLEEFAETVLAERYSPLLAGALNHQADALGINRSVLRPALGSEQPPYAENLRFGEVFPTPHGVVAVEARSQEGRYRRTPDGHIVASGVGTLLTLYGIGSEQVREPLTEIGELITEKFGSELQTTRYSNERFDALKEEDRTSPPKPTAEEEASARLLSDDAARRAVRAIATSGGLLRQDLPKHLGDAADRSAEIERQLRDSPLVTVDLVVTCKARSTQVARAPSREALEKMAENGLKCACGRDVLSERIEEALSLTDHGRKMLNGSYWMTVLVITELVDLGIELDQMLVEEVAGGDEMDFFVDVSGDLVLMELKDKEFNLGNAYSFGSKTGIFQPDHPVIVTSAYVGNDAKQHFEQAASARQKASRFRDPEAGSVEIEYIEGLENLRGQLKALIGRIYEVDATRVLSGVLPHGIPSGQTLVVGLKEQAAKVDSTGAEVPAATRVGDRPA